MIIIVNGDSMTLDDGLSVSMLLERLKLTEKRVVVEVNEEIIDKNNFPENILSDGSKVEIIQFVPGG